MIYKEKNNSHRNSTMVGKIPKHRHIKYFNILLPFLFALTFSNAFAQNVRSDAIVWYTQLPACPCRSPDFNGVKFNDGWARDKGNLEKYHKGASTSFRSYPANKTVTGKSCQQCCYDYKGDLITSGRAAGTPDKVSSCSGEDKNGNMKLAVFGLVGHFFKDVSPWNRYMKHDSTGWVKYNALWVPNEGDHCKANNR